MGERQRSVVRWPEPLSATDARAVVDAWARTSRRVDDRVSDGDIVATDASVAVLTVEALVEHRSADTVRIDAVAFPHPTIARVPLDEVPATPPTAFEERQRSFVFADSVRFSRDEACHGRGEVDCTVCRGTGDVPCDRFEPCPACTTDTGAPSHGARDATATCPVCLGNARRPCSTCGGTGRTTCPGCDGRRRFDCERCSGSGDLLVGEVATVGWTVRSASTEVGEWPRARRRRSVDGRRWTLDGDEVPSGLPPRVTEAAAELLAPRPHEVARRLHVDVLPVTHVTIETDTGAVALAIVGDDHEVVAPPSRERSGLAMAVGVLLALVLVAALVSVAATI